MLPGASGLGIGRPEPRLRRDAPACRHEVGKAPARRAQHPALDQLISTRQRFGDREVSRGTERRSWLVKLLGRAIKSPRQGTETMPSRPRGLRSLALDAAVGNRRDDLGKEREESLGIGRVCLPPGREPAVGYPDRGGSRRRTLAHSRPRDRASERHAGSGRRRASELAATASSSSPRSVAPPGPRGSSDGHGCWLCRSRRRGVLEVEVVREHPPRLDVRAHEPVRALQHTLRLRIPWLEDHAKWVAFQPAQMRHYSVGAYNQRCAQRRVSVAN